MIISNGRKSPSARATSSGLVALPHSTRCAPHRHKLPSRESALGVGRHLICRLVGGRIGFTKNSSISRASKPVNFRSSSRALSSAIRAERFQIPTGFLVTPVVHEPIMSHLLRRHIFRHMHRDAIQAELLGSSQSHMSDDDDPIRVHHDRLPPTVLPIERATLSMARAGIFRGFFS